jgi:hypothetical protein
MVGGDVASGLISCADSMTESAKQLAVDSDYPSAYRGLWVRLLIFAGSIIAFMALLYISIVFDSWLRWVVIAGAFSSVAMGGWLFHSWKCPRCGNTYFVERSRGWVIYSNPLVGKCLHCGLKLHA